MYGSSNGSSRGLPHHPPTPPLLALLGFPQTHSCPPTCLARLPQNQSCPPTCLARLLAAVQHKRAAPTHGQRGAARAAAHGQHRAASVHHVAQAKGGQGHTAHLGRGGQVRGGGERGGTAEEWGGCVCACACMCKPGAGPRPQGKAVKTVRGL